MTGRMLGAGLGVIAMLVTLVWALGLGLDPVTALLRSLISLIVMFLVGLMLGRAMADSVASSPPSDGKSAKKAKEDKKGP